MTPTIETIRPGVQFTPPAAASFRRAEADWGRPIDVNSTFRDPELQLRMYNAWLAYVQGRGPHPGHSRALHPDDSVHCDGEALDSDDWRTPGFIAFMAERGWIRTAAWDPTEQHHFEYQWWRDRHRNRPATTDGKPFPETEPEPEIPEEEDEDMPIIIKKTGADEWSLLDPDVGLDLPQMKLGAVNKFRGEKTKRGVVNTFRGVIVTTDPDIGKSWSRTHCRRFGNVPQDRRDADYRIAQVEASRLSAEKHPQG